MGKLQTTFSQHLREYEVRVARHSFKLSSQISQAAFTMMLDVSIEDVLKMAVEHLQKPAFRREFCEWSAGLEGGFVTVSSGERTRTLVRETQRPAMRSYAQLVAYCRSAPLRSARLRLEVGASGRGAPEAAGAPPHMRAAACAQPQRSAWSPPPFCRCSSWSDSGDSETSKSASYERRVTVSSGSCSCAVFLVGNERSSKRPLRRNSRCGTGVRSSLGSA